MSESDFATTILTSKSPEEVAKFLPHSLQLSSKLIEKNLLAWFSNYANMISRYNQDLNILVSNGRDFFTTSGAEFGSLDKIWNCVASSVMSQIQVNEALIKTIKNDVVNQFEAAFRNDFKYSELLINSDELCEMQSTLDDPNGAYNWNVKAPAILSNFENYKKFEKELIFNAFISYLNTVNSKTASLVHKNENAVNFILKEYHIDTEMNYYTDYMVKTNLPGSPAKPKASHGSNHTSDRPQSTSAPSKSSVNSGTSHGTTSTKDKRKSKLRSRMGSILGRKKKPGTALHKSEAIPEDESVSSLPSRQNTNVSRPEQNKSTYNGTSSSRQTSTVKQDVPVNVAAQNPEAPQAESTAFIGAGAGAASFSTPGSELNHVQKQGFPQTFNAPPLKPSDPQAQKQVSGASSPNSNYNHQTTKDEANFVKLSSSDEESDVPTDRNGNRLSLLNAHDLGQPPKVENDSDNRSRNTSSGKYSFEYGDETKSISTPQQTPTRTTAPQFENTGTNTFDSVGVEMGAVPSQKNSSMVPEGSSSAQVPFEQRNVSSSTFDHSHRPAPPPPPSRKVHPTTNEVRRDLFQHLSSARDSIIPSAADKMSLISQTTGNSLLKQDYFKHFGSSNELIKEGLNTSVAEIINVTFVHGQVTKSQVLGEIAFNYNSSTPLDHVAVIIPTPLTKSLLNDQLMSKQDNDTYLIKIAPIAGKTLGGIKYSIDAVPTTVPILLKQIWKFENHQASLIIKLSLNAQYSRAVKLDNLMISASLDSSVSSTSASSKPEGSFNKDINRITWRYNEPVVLDDASPEVKLIARIMTNGQGKESSSGTKVRFTINEASSFIQLLDLNGMPIPSMTSLSSGNYSSHA